MEADMEDLATGALEERDEAAEIRHLLENGQPYNPEPWERRLSKLSNRTRGYWVTRELIHQRFPLVCYAMNLQIQGLTGAEMDDGDLADMARVFRDQMAPMVERNLSYLEAGEGEERLAWLLEPVPEGSIAGASKDLDETWGELRRHWDEQGRPVKEPRRQS
jgi:hypothetical protein